MSKHPLVPQIATTRIGGVPIAAATLSQLADAMVYDCYKSLEVGDWVARTVFDINAQGLSMRETNSEYRTAMDQADIIHADGGFLVPVSRFRSGPSIPERSATTDFIWEAACRAEASGLSFYLLGGEPGLAQRAACRIKERHPKLRIAGIKDCFFDAKQEAEIINEINRSGTDVLWVGMGKPREQTFAIRHKQSLRVGWIVTCGGCFNFVTGDYRRAPAWMQRACLEWLHRLACRPRSLLMRNLVTNPHALYLALTR
jgi:N-acetylglucosaminyldiphosphoundecaprenol N-acetyl-beta-D-mannosaminyltransferase